ncbi:TonB-dependent receptor [Flavihumibacter sp. R14]|nr:TonB-dependent receptor [Flavihumibacter soli]
MKIACVLSLLMICNMNGVAQSVIRGKVTDKNGKAVQGANVVLLGAKDSAMVKGAIASADGSYILENIKPGNYRITSSFIGYKQFYSGEFTLTESPGTKDIPVSLEEIGVNLEEVVISAKKPLYEQKVDRMVINVQSSIVAVGGTALDVLERSPGVMVNRQNNSLSISGKDGVVVMINGKINYMPVSAILQLLEGTSAGNIEKIELITTPPAKYDAEGNAGFINIVMVNNPGAGTNGSYSLSLGYGLGETSLASMNFNHRSAKVNFYGDYSFLRTHQPQRLTSYRQVNNVENSIENSSVSERDPTVNVHNGRLGMDYEISKKTILGALLSGYYRKWTMDAVNEVRILNNEHLDTTLTIVNDELNRWKNYGINVNAQHTFTNTGVLTANLDHLYYHQTNPSGYLNSYYNGSGLFLYENQTKSGKETPINMWVSNADYSRKLGKKIDLEMGLKAAVSRFTNDVRVDRLLQTDWEVDDALTAKYNLKEQIGAAYSSVSFNINPKIDMKLGLRYEYTISNLGSDLEKDIVDRSYGNLFPTFFISRKISEHKSLNLSYNKRIARPTFNDMAPFVIFIDPNTFFAGNAALQPSISNSLSTSYSYKNYIFSLSYSHDDNAIAGFQSHIDSTINREVLTSENLDHIKNLSLTMVLPVDISSWWNIQNNLLGRWQQVNGFYNSDKVRIDKTTFQIVSSHNFKLPKDWSMELTGFYQSADMFGLAVMKPFAMVNFGVQKKISKQRNTFSLNIEDVFNSGVFKAYSLIPEQNVNTRFEGRFDQRTVKVTFSHQFGNDKLTGARERKTASEEERRRVTQ